MIGLNIVIIFLLNSIPPPEKWLLNLHNNFIRKTHLHIKLINYLSQELPSQIKMKRLLLRLEIGDWSRWSEAILKFPIRLASTLWHKRWSRNKRFLLACLSKSIILPPIGFRSWKWLFLSRMIFEISKSVFSTFFEIRSRLRIKIFGSKFWYLRVVTCRSRCERFNLRDGLVSPNK